MSCEFKVKYAFISCKNQSLCFIFKSNAFISCIIQMTSFHVNFKRLHFMQTLGFLCKRFMCTIYAM